MRPSNQERGQRDRTSMSDPWAILSSYEVRRRPDPNTQSSFRAASASLEDALSRLQHIRNTLRDLEANGSIVQHRPGEASGTDVGPAHAAIVLSEDDLSTLDPEALRNRLDELGATLPQYIRSAASIIRNLTHRTADYLQDARVSSQASAQRQTAEGLVNITQHPTTLSIRNPSAIQTLMSRSLTPPHTQTSNAASGRFIRPRRNSNPFAEGVTVYRRQEIIRDDDPASTTLGRRVASRAAAAGRSLTETTRVDQRMRASGNSALSSSDHFYPPLAVSGSTNASHVPGRTRVPHIPSRRVPLLEHGLLENARSHIDDSEGSETEVDDSIERLTASNDAEGPRRMAGMRQRSESDGPSRPALRPVSPDSPELANSTGFSSPVASPRREENQAITSLRVREMRERLDRISNALTNAPRDRRLSSSFTDRDLNGDLFTQFIPNAEGRENTYGEFIETDEGRTYRVRRRVNANGEEQIHRIRTDEWWADDDDFADSVFTSGPSVLSGGRRTAAERVFERLPGSMSWGQSLQNESSTSGTSSGSGIEVGRPSRRIGRNHDRVPEPTSHNTEEGSPITTRRRRGWARLNADGDEVPTDEEEEIERNRTEQRIRNSRSAFNNAFATSRARLEYLAPTTRNVFIYGAEESEEGSSDATRIRLHLPGQVHRRVQQLANSARDGLATENVTEQESLGTLEPYYLCPLPTPLELMTLDLHSPKPKHRQMSQPKGLTVSYESEMAAR
ncbi:hypothetical protein EW145_g430 [Phellinidium pouzarii]|uniref:Uncharacterized protein n=1 Tax=Phellinidium pouzarii TaxID=167371 RepID=A0A4S4LIJ8_9AGAM|nr:hypothetical protein EW145_g430 [Phellinidium pouzarii]